MIKRVSHGKREDKRPFKPNCRSEVRGTEGEEAESVVVAELELLLDLVDCAHQPPVDLADVASLF